MPTEVIPPAWITAISAIKRPRRSGVEEVLEPWGVTFRAAGICIAELPVFWREGHPRRTSEGFYAGVDKL